MLDSLVLLALVVASDSCFGALAIINPANT